MKVLSVIDLAFAVPGDLQKITGGYAYARQLFALLPQFGVAPHHLQLPGPFPFPTQDDLAATAQVFAQLHPNTTLMVDGLAYGALPGDVLDGISQRVIGLVHHPLALESGLTEGQKSHLKAAETLALAKADRVIATSPTTARLLQSNYNVPGGCITVAAPGTTQAARASGGSGSVNLLAVGAVIPRKDYLGLIGALGQLQVTEWHLTIVGAVEHNTGYAQRVREAILASGLRSQIELVGEVSAEELDRHFTRANIFVMPSRYEGYGMVLTEAVARGLPIVCTTAGAMAETVSDDVAVKVHPGDPSAFAKALEELLVDPGKRKQKADAAWEMARSLPTWENCAERVADVVKSLSGAK